MGLFETSYDDMKKNTGAKFLSQGVYLLTFARAEYLEAKSGNKGVALGFYTGFDDKEGNPEVKFKNYYLMEQDGQTMKHKSLSTLRETIFKVFGIKWEEVSSIDDLSQWHKLKGLAQQLTKLAQDKKATITYGWPDRAGSNGKYYQEILWVNEGTERELAYRQANTKFAFSSNPNPKADAAGDDTLGNGGVEGTVFDTSNDAVELPF
jgi:hypothetical protein